MMIKFIGCFGFGFDFLTWRCPAGVIRALSMEFLLWRCPVEVTRRIEGNICVWTNAAISLTMVKYGGVKSNFGDWKLGMKYGEAWWYRASWVYWCSLGRAALRDLGGFWPWRLERKLLMENDPLWPK